jgi:glycosyltransferase involved in cell wall biosynthesis
MRTEKKNTVSIALAAYNGEKYIREQLDSFAVQSVLPDEVVISDDGSSDATVRIAEEFAGGAPFPVYVVENGGRGGFKGNFENALTRCTKEIVFLSDQDDAWRRKKIEKVLEVFAGDPDAVTVIHDLEYCDERMRPIGQSKLERINSFSDPVKEYVTGMASAVRRSFLETCLPFPADTSITHDVWIHGCAFVAGGKRILSEVLADYRRHALNASSEGGLNVAEVTDKRYFTKSFLRDGSLGPIVRHAALTEALLEWTKKNKEHIKDYEEKRKELELDLRFTRRRIEILGQRRFHRPIPVIKQYVSGGYRRFSGIKSALKDILIN